MESGAQNHTKGSQLWKILGSGVNLQQVMNFERGPYNIHKQPTFEDVTKCETYDDHGHCHEI